MGRPRIYKNKAEQRKHWRELNKEKIALWHKEWNKNHKEEIKTANIKWRKNNPDKVSAINMSSYWKMKIENPKRLREIGIRANRKYMLKPEFKNQQRIRHQISELFRRKGYRRMCEICESYKTEIHHQDYNNPYDIIFLCHKCHMALHKLLKGTEEDPQILYERQIISN